MAGSSKEAPFVVFLTLAHLLHNLLIGPGDLTGHRLKTIARVAIASGLALRHPVVVICLPKMTTMAAEDVAPATTALVATTTAVVPLLHAIITILAIAMVVARPHVARGPQLTMPTHRLVRATRKTGMMPVVPHPVGATNLNLM